MVEFRARTTNNRFNDFIAFFSDRDAKIRRLNKLVQGRAMAAGYHSSANVEAINKYIDDKVNVEMVNLAAVDEAAIGTILARYL